MSLIKIAGFVAILGSLNFLAAPCLTPGLYQLSPRGRLE